MKYLKIESNKGSYLKENSDWEEIDKINKDELMYLLNKAIDVDFEMDPYDAARLPNKAHSIIYKNLHDKFSELLDNKSRFKDESEQLYKGAIEKNSFAYEK